MFTFTSRVLSRILALAIVVLAGAVIAALTSPALAFKVSGTHSESDIQSHCAKAGGVFFSGDAGYSCEAAGGKVTCGKDGKCYGDCKTCPATSKPKSTVFGVLSGATLKAATSTSTKKTTTPVHIKRPIAESNTTRTAHRPKK